MTTKNQTLEILKQALLLESRGRAFYRKVAENAESEPVKEFFQLMADEEEKHVAMLRERFNEYHEKNCFGACSYEMTGEHGHEAVITDDLKGKIAAAGFEAAAVSAAMAFEERAIKLYAGRAASAQDPQEKKLYEWLADWERGHLKLLADIDRDISEQIWNDNQFAPF
ncbi:MAG: ferritin family protein [Desulfobacterales bacterium]